MIDHNHIYTGFITFTLPIKHLVCLPLYPLNFAQPLFLLGVTVISSETVAKAYAKFWAMRKWQMTKWRTDMG